jgi:hypothetical protein
LIKLLIKLQLLIFFDKKNIINAELKLKNQFLNDNSDNNSETNSYDYDTDTDTESDCNQKIIFVKSASYFQIE